MKEPENKQEFTDIKSSPSEIEKFIESSVYTDYASEIDIRIEHTRALLDDVELNYSGRQYDLFRGRLRNLQEMKEIFSDMMENKIHDLELLERENQNGNKQAK